MYLDARNHPHGQGNLHPPGQAVQVGMVGTCRDDRAQNRRHQDPTGELEVE